MKIMALALALTAAGCTTMGLGGKDDPPLTAAHNAALGETPPRTGFYALLDSEASAAAFAAQQQAVLAPGGGVAVPWEGGGTSGTATPGPIHIVNARACRDVVLATERDQKRLSGRTTLCHKPDGTWQPLGADL